MQNRILLNLLILVILLSCGTDSIKSHWALQPINVDGDGDEWDTQSLLYLEDLDMMLGVCNTDQALNILIRFNDPQLARMLMARGFTLWFSDDDDQAKKLGIHVQKAPIGLGNGTQRLNYRNRKQKLPPEQQVELMSKYNPEYVIAWNDSITSFSLNEFAGIEAANKYQDGLFCYEFSIPIQPIDNSQYFLASSEIGMISVGFEITSLSEKELKIMKDRMKSERGGGLVVGGRGGGRQGGGGRRGGMRGGGRPGGSVTQPDTDGKEYRAKILLAEK